MRYLLFVLFAALALDAGETSVTIPAGKFDRAPAIVRFAAPAGLQPGPYTIADAKGSLYLQVEGKEAWCVVPELKSGETRTLKVSTEAPYFKPGYGVDAKKGDIAVDFTINGARVFSYNYTHTALPDKVDPVFKRGGYIFPLFTPGGVQILDDFPGDHYHHHGIWTAWTKTEFEGRHPDFWNMGQKLGTIEPVALDSHWSGAVQAGFTSRHKFIDLKAPEPVVVLNEAWQVRLYHTQEVRLFDFEMEQNCATDKPLKLPKYHYGGIGVRGHAQWNGPPNMEFLTSEGKTRANGNETTGKWCAMTGKVDGKPQTLAILCHPENFRFPQPMRLNPKEPFFCYAPQQGGEFSLEPGKPYRAKYRFAVMDGAPDAKRIEQLWSDYAEPVMVSVESK